MQRDLFERFKFATGPERDELLEALKGAGAERAGLGLTTGGSLSTTTSNLAQQLRDLPGALGPALVEAGTAAGKTLIDPDFYRGLAAVTTPLGLTNIPGTPDAPGGFGDISRFRDTAGAEFAQEEFEFTRDYFIPGKPLKLGEDADGRPLYLKKRGGSTYELKDAATSLGEKFEAAPLQGLAAASLAVPVGGTAIGAGLRLGARAGTPAIKKASQNALRRSIEPRTIRTRSGEKLERPVAFNPFTAAAQRAATRGSAELGNLVERGAQRVTGRDELTLPFAETARAQRGITKRRRREQRSQEQRTLDEFDRAFRPLSGREQVAVVMRAQGVRPSEMIAFIDKQIADVEGKLAAVEGKLAAVPFVNPEAAKLRGNRRDARRLRSVMGRVPDELFDSVDRSPKLSRAFDEADRVVNTTGDILEAMDVLSPEARALRPFLTKRVVEGAEFRSAPEARRLAKDERARGEAEADRLEASTKTEVKALSRERDQQIKDVERARQGQFRAGTQLTGPEKQARREVRETGRELRKAETELQRASRAQLDASGPRTVREAGGRIDELERVHQPLFDRFRDDPDRQRLARVNPQIGRMNRKLTRTGTQLTTAREKLERLQSDMVRRPPKSESARVNRHDAIGRQDRLVRELEDRISAQRLGLEAFRTRQLGTKNARDATAEERYGRNLEEALASYERRGETPPPMVQRAVDLYDELVSLREGTTKARNIVEPPPDPDTVFSTGRTAGRALTDDERADLLGFTSDDAAASELRFREIKQRVHQVEERHELATKTSDEAMTQAQRAYGEALATAERLTNELADTQRTARETRERGDAAKRSARDEADARAKEIEATANEFVGDKTLEAIKADVAKNVGDLITFPHVGPGLRGQGLRRQGAGAGKARPPDSTKRNRAFRLNASRWIPSPNAWRSGAVKAIAYAAVRERGEFAYREAIDLDPDVGVPDGWYVINPDGAKVARGDRERAATTREQSDMAVSRDMDDYLAAGDHDILGHVDQNLATKNPPRLRDVG